MGEQVAAGFYGGVAQLGEHLPCKQGVKSSNLSISSCTKTETELCASTYLENRILNETRRIEIFKTSEELQ